MKAFILLDIPRRRRRAFAAKSKVKYLAEKFEESVWTEYLQEPFES